MSETLFEIEPEATPPLMVEVTGYIRAVNVTLRVTKCGEVEIPRYHLDVESFRETKEAVASYVEEWGDPAKDWIMKAKIVAEEVVEDARERGEQV